MNQNQDENQNWDTTVHLSVINTTYHNFLMNEKQWCKYIATGHTERTKIAQITLVLSSYTYNFRH